MIGIFGFFDLCYMQYLYKYTNILDANGILYDVVFWHRDKKLNVNPEFKGKTCIFNYPIDTYQPFHKKIFCFLKYAAFMRKIIAKNKYDKIIILTTQTAIPLWDILLFKYKGRYIFDYRDITKEKKSKVYCKIVRELFNKSYCTMVSSKGFLRTLNITENQNIILSHNRQFACKKSGYTTRLTENTPLRVVFWGIVRQIDFNKKICDIFANDSRFDVYYHGTGFYKELEEYCDKRGYNNIFFTGKYLPEEIDDFVSETDILLSIYENDTVQKPALTVKFYDGIYYRIPMLVNKDSYLAEVSQHLSGVYSVDIESRKCVTDKIYKWYKELSSTNVDEDYSEIEEKIFYDDLYFEKKLLEFVLNKN